MMVHFYGMNPHPCDIVKLPSAVVLGAERPAPRLILGALTIYRAHAHQFRKINFQEFKIQNNHTTHMEFLHGFDRKQVSYFEGKSFQFYISWYCVYVMNALLDILQVEGGKQEVMKDGRVEG